MALFVVVVLASAAGTALDCGLAACLNNLTYTAEH
jgi:hypothetical protein